jgi:hypothetical protein
MLDYQEMGHRYNYDDVFFRNLLIGFIKNFKNQIHWQNKFRDEIVDVIVPIYYSMSGDVRFLYDAFVDDPVTCRFELDYQKVPVAVVTMDGFTIQSSKQTNPNVMVRYIVENSDTTELKAMYSKLKAVPITVNFKLQAILDSELDLLKYCEAILTYFYNYKFYTFQHKHLKVDAFFSLPDSLEPEISRDINSTDKRVTNVGISFTVETFFPIFDGKNYDPNYSAYTNNDDPRANAYEGEDINQNDYLPITQIGADKKMIAILHNMLDNINEKEMESEWIPEKPDDYIDPEELTDDGIDI